MDISQRTEDKEAGAGPPHEALFLVLSFLPLYELLSMTRVCDSLRDAVNKDVLIWLDIVVERPLSLRLRDDVLMKFTSRANGRLRTLCLINCDKVTDDGLQQVVVNNPLLNKLHIPGCTSLTPEGVLRAIKTLSHHSNILNSIMINGIYKINKQHLEEIQSYLRTNQPFFIDVEICPKCDQVRTIFDCPRNNCRPKRENSSNIACRGCIFCIPRCQECGGCVEPEELEETVCADILCSSCWLQLPKCNLCNKPYCKQHADRSFGSPESVGFVCDVCHERFFENSGYRPE